MLPFPARSLPLRERYTHDFVSPVASLSSKIARVPLRFSPTFVPALVLPLPTILVRLLLFRAAIADTFICEMREFR